MEPTAVIKSAHDGTTLEFTAPTASGYNARLRGANFFGTASVYPYEPANLAKFFRDLANHWKGWPGKKEWGSLEGELSLGATIDSLGHISLAVELRSGPYPFHWNLSTVLLLEAGQLERIASAMESFISGLAGAHE